MIKTLQMVAILPPAGAKSIQEFIVLLHED